MLLQRVPGTSWRRSAW